MRMAIAIGVAVLLCVALVIRILPEREPAPASVLPDAGLPPVTHSTTPDPEPEPASPMVPNTMEQMLSANPTASVDCQNDVGTSRQNLTMYLRGQLGAAPWQKQGEQMIIDPLAASSDAEHLYVASVLTGNDAPGARLSRIERAAEIDPANALVATQWLYLCAEHADDCGVPIADIERRAIEAEKGNARTWAAVASARVARGDKAGALDALRQANATSEYRDGWFDRIELFERALAASTSASAHARLIAAVGMTASTPNDAIEVLMACESEGKTSSVWRVECLRLGEVMAASGETVTTQAMGLGLQAKMHEFAGDERREKEREADAKKLMAAYETLTDSPRLEDAWRNENLLRLFLETGQARGELAGMEAVVAEAERLANEPGYDPCQILSDPNSR